MKNTIKLPELSHEEFALLSTISNTDGILAKELWKAVTAKGFYQETYGKKFTALLRSLVIRQLTEVEIVPSEPQANRQAPSQLRYTITPAGYQAMNQSLEFYITLTPIRRRRRKR